MNCMQPPANLVGLEQPYRKDCTGENGRSLERGNGHDHGCLAGIGAICEVAESPAGRHLNQSTLDAIGFGRLVIGCAEICAVQCWVSVRPCELRFPSAIGYLQSN